MATHGNIRILADGNNARGDLFARLMGDLFLTLGYDNVRFNIARSGREIDIEAEHRHERRRAIAECKAWEGKVGGTEINTFAGRLRPEKGRHPRVPITPYFISLSGFTETSIDQEEESGDDAVILLDAAKIIGELVKGRILVPLERATEVAGRYAGLNPTLTLDGAVDLLAHARGWVWAVYYGIDSQRTHVVLVHADGTALSSKTALEVMAAAGETLPGIVCINEAVTPADDRAQQDEAINRYYKYLNSECGFILLDGLPADAEVGTLRLRLENLLVPLRLAIGSPESVEFRDDNSFRATTPPKEQLSPSRAPRPIHVGEMLAKHPRLAVLASPGAGKSTLVKRLAVAYADPTRRVLIDDGLLEMSWIPLFFRCRELRNKARASFNDLLDALVERALIEDLKQAFRTKIEHALRSGEILLLIDGLDEIADAGDRAAFVRNIRTVLAIYPGVSLVATSRAAGFRHVAGLLAAVCTPAQLAPFNDEDIRRLTVAWHREVVGARPDVELDAARLAKTICGNDRIKLLAGNPLLLTTLLLVKRWVGQLPTRRSVLYGKAVEVLLMTWNVEGHAPLEQDEALPQLCYVASAMMHRGIQKISRPELVALLSEARRQLTAELAFARIGVAEFIERVENRSSLLMKTGVDVVDGTLLEFYEFRHLTFQEYLTAKAVVEGWYQQRLDTDSIVSVLEPHLSDAKWREVIPLAAVLAGRKADPLILRLINHPDKRMFRMLVACLADEVQATPATIRSALEIVASKNVPGPTKANVALIVRSKYGRLLREAVGQLFLSEPTISRQQFLGQIVETQLTATNEPPGVTQELEVTALLKDSDILKRCEGALALSRIIRNRLDCEFAEEWSGLTALLLTEGPAAQSAACQVFARSEIWIWASAFSQIQEIFDLLLVAWREAPSPEVRLLAAQAVAHVPLLRRDNRKAVDGYQTDEFVRSKIVEDFPEKAAAVVASYYRQSPFVDSELLGLLDGCDAPLAPWRNKLGPLYKHLSKA
jgi:hypothetical protein